ncbi:MAG: ABC transporter, permease/ATP-binding protein [candidate division TM6 bacterium GW2011_GWE2_42_60]|nr:MAG: ABC transporter, permease/ATP-binding protein [candidate division TM6 bacterium GW2011_GWE2_42_60]HBY05635.1 hypothetical protein [Candidatus Dependentiae bacterium]
MGFFKRWVSKPAQAVSLITIDFSKPWWSILWAQKGMIVVILLSTLVYEILDTIFPLLIGKALDRASISFLVLVLSPYLLEEVVSWFIIRPIITRLHAQTVESFRYSASRALLIIDPTAHATHSSGVSMGKIRRTTEAYFKLVKKLLDDLVPLTIILITTIASVLSYNTQLGLAVGAVIVFLALLFSTVITLVTKPYELQANRDDDRANHVGTESISRVQFIRSSFASDQVEKQLNDGYLAVMRSSTTFFMTYRLLRGFFVFIYIVAIGCIAALLISMIKSGALTSATALALLVMILRSTHPLLKIDKYVTEAVSAYRKITDFYTYIRTYGAQTYPVLANERGAELSSQMCVTDPISLIVDHASASYIEGKPLLKDISLQLAIPRSATNKLFGIIGPSGIGKTTFLSLIGGQLKPSGGHILINGCDIYQINDSQRQRLIALQGQIATNVFGALRYNITFGLPADHAYSDQVLIDLLDSVGLWFLFKEKKGLDTMIGEGGFTLSGGQRQRLNFANLYLRAKTYKPSLILIDEPTSSLDEVSEQKITDLIDDLAKTSLTLVIAHRLKTLEDAHKILDFCLINESSSLIFYDRHELHKRSPYYQKLIEGHALLEE